MREKGRDNTDAVYVCVCICTAVKLNTMMYLLVSDDEGHENS